MYLKHTSKAQGKHKSNNVKAEDGIEPSLSDLQSHTLAIMILNLVSL